MGNGFIQFLPWMFIAFGLFLAGGSLWVIRNETRGRHWREIEGQITRYRTHTSRNYEGMVSTLHSAEIEYKFSGMRPPCWSTMSQRGLFPKSAKPSACATIPTICPR